MKAGGLVTLPASEQAVGAELFGELKEFGVFVCPVGELESWFGGQFVGHGKARFLDLALSHLGDDPAAPTYLRPEGDDVWEFLDQIAIWTRNPDRAGIPT